MAPAAAGESLPQGKAEGGNIESKANDHRIIGGWASPSGD